MNDSLVVFDLDAEALANLVNICTQENKSPSEVIGNMIRTEADKQGLIPQVAKSA